MNTGENAKPEPKKKQVKVVLRRLEKLEATAWCSGGYHECG